MYGRGMGEPVMGSMLVQAQAPGGYHDCGDYPCDIGVLDSIQCAFNPWSTTCSQLKERADLERAQYAGLIQTPNAPPIYKPPPEALTPGPGPTSDRTPDEILNGIIGQQDADWKAEMRKFFEEQAARNPNPDKGLDWMPIALIVGAVALVGMFRG